MNQELKERLNKISLTHYLKITGKWNRKRVNICIEEIYLNILRENHIIISDLVNSQIEKWLREKGFLNIEKYIEKEKLEQLKNSL